MLAIANRYEIRGSLGEGAMGLVHHVTDTATGTEMALKVISAKIGQTAKSVMQFRQEFRLMAQLRHPNCCEVYDFGVLADESPYFTMELVPGQSLDEMLPQPADRVRDLLTQLLQALGYIHQLGYIHRDIKSQNVRVRPDGTLKLMDYGLMEYAGRAGGPIAGTVGYMAPEIIKRGPLDQRTDLYAVGCLAYELLTGRLPFEGDKPMDVLRAQVNDAPPPPGCLVSGLDVELERTVLKLLAKEPLERFQSAQEVLSALGVESAGGVTSLLASPLVGRELEMSFLNERLMELAAGAPGGAIMLSGAAGVGKSRLVEEFRFSVQLENVLYAVGGSREQGTSPYAPLIAVFRQLLPALREYLPDLLDAHAPVLVKLLPELEVAPAPDLDPPVKEKLRLQGTLAELLARLAEVRPFVMTLDDWQWADPLSAEFLPYLLRSVHELPAMILMTSRPEGNSAPLPQGVRVLGLAPLGDGDVHRIVTSMLGTAHVDPAFVEAVAGVSGGNPFFMKELIDHLVQNATLVNEGGRWNTHVGLTADRLPRTIKGLLLRKIGYLGQLPQQVARCAAVLGHRFDIDTLQTMTGLPEEQLFMAMETLRFHQVLDELEDEANYRFAQDQLATILYEAISEDDRKNLHAAAASALEAGLRSEFPVRTAAQAPLARVAAVARHAMLGHLDEQTLPYLTEAGLRSIKLFALADAESYLEAALAVARLDGDRLAEYVFDCLNGLADIARARGQSLKAVEAYAELMPLAPKVGREHLLPAMLTSCAKAHQMKGDLDAAFDWCAQGLAESEKQGNTHEMVRNLLTSCRLHFFRGNTADAMSQTRRALAIARSVQDRMRLGEALAFLGYLQIAAGKDESRAGMEALFEAADLLIEVGDKIGLQNCYNLLGDAQTQQGDFIEAKDTFLANYRLCYEAGLYDDEAISLLNLAVVCLELGAFGEAAQHAQAALQHGEATDNAFQVSMALTLNAVAQAYLGEYGGAVDLVNRAVTTALESKNRYAEMLAIQYKVELYLVLGHMGEAKTAAKDLIALIQETGNLEPESRMNAFLGEIVGRQGDVSGGATYVELALPQATARGAKGIEARALKVKAWLELQKGEWATAREAAGQALMLASAIGMQYLVAELEGILGEIALATRSEDPTPHFDVMEGLATQMGSDLLLAQALFGQAAALGNPVMAVPKVKRAQDLLKALMAPLDEDGRLCFANLRERDRILQGDFINGFKPRMADTSIKVSLPGVRFGQGGW